MADNINFEEVKKAIKAKVSEITEVAESDLKDEADFTNDLGVDSMMALEIVASIEKMYKVAVPEEDIPQIRSLTNVYEIVKKLLGL